MSFRLILLAGVAMTALTGAARAQDTYRCGDSVCYDDQADETRRLNEMQLENPGAGMDAVPGADDSYDPADDDGEADDDPNGQGGPYYPVEPGDGARYPPDADQPDDGSYGPGDAPDTYQSDDDDDAYPDEGAPPDDAYDDDGDLPYPDEDDD